MTEQMRPPYVRFERRSVEDRTKALENGRYGFKDLDIAKITVPGQKDTVEKEVEAWLGDLDKQATDGRVPFDWPANFRKAFDFWKNGQELPLSGTPIKGWPVLSPSQQETLLLMGLQTVEDLAAASDEALRIVGTGSTTLKSKAQAWLRESQGTGKLAEENASLRRDLEAQKEQTAQLFAAFEDLKKRLPTEAKETVADVSKASF